MFSFSIIKPPAVAIIRPAITYIDATLYPKIDINIISEAKSTMGEDIKKEKVTPNGKPALVNPINKGMLEQEQKGVTVPSNADIMFAEIPWNFVSILFDLSAGK